MTLATYLVLRAAVSTARQQYIRYWLESETEFARTAWSGSIQELNDAEIDLKGEVGKPLAERRGVELIEPPRMIKVQE